MDSERIQLDGFFIYRQHGSWLIETGEEGGRIRKALGTNDKLEAIQRAALFASTRKLTPEDAAAHIEKQKQWLAEATVSTTPPHKVASLVDTVLPGQQPPTVEAIAKAVVLLTHPPAATIPIAKALDEWTMSKQVKQCKELYLKNVRTAVLECAAMTGAVNVSDLDEERVSKYMHWRAGKKQSDATLCHKFGYLSTFLTFAKRRHYITEDCTKSMDRPRVAVGYVEYYNADHIEKKLKALRGHRLENLLGFATYTGLRRGELAKLTPEDIDIKGQMVRVQNQPGMPVKTRRNRAVMLVDQALPYAQRLVDGAKAGKVFPWRSWGDISKAANDFGMGLQLLRHSAVTHWLLNALPEHLALKWAGHDRRTQEERYAGYRPGDRRLEMTLFGRPLSEVGSERRTGR